MKEIQQDGKMDSFLVSCGLGHQEVKSFYSQLEQLVQLIHSGHSQGQSPATSTNYSFVFDVPVNFSSLGEGANSSFIVMTRSGIDKGACRPSDFLVVNLQGEILFHQEPVHRPSAEAPLHLALYRQFPHIRCILHSHSILSSVLSRYYLAEGAMVFEGLEIQKGLKGIFTHESRVRLPIVANTQDMEELGRLLPTLELAQSWGLLLAGHGLYAWE